MASRMSCSITRQFVLLHKVTAQEINIAEERILVFFLISCELAAELKVEISQKPFITSFSTTENYTEALPAAPYAPSYLFLLVSLNHHIVK